MKKKGIGYYFKLNIKTFQGRITAGFIAVGLLVLTIILYPMETYKRIIGRYEFLISNTLPIKYYCSVMENCISQTDAALDNFLLTGDRVYQQERQRLWKEEYRGAIDSLLVYTNVGEDVKASSRVYDLIVRANRLRAEQDKIEREFVNRTTGSKLNEESITATRNEQISRLALFGEDIQTDLQLIVKLQNDAVGRTNAANTADAKNIFTVSLVMTLIVMMICGFIGTIIITSILDKIKVIKYSINELGNGDLPAEIPQSKDELGSIAKAINTLTQNLYGVKQFALQVGEGNFGSEFTAFHGSGMLGEALIQMRDSLKVVSEEEQKRAWVANGLAMFAQLLRDHSQNLDDLSEVVISELVKYINANQGGIYIVVADTYTKSKLELKSCYAFERKKYKERIIDSGEGVIGEAYREKRTVYITALPENYVRITSGLGDANPRSLLIVPLKVNEEVEGMIELASFHKFEPYQIEFVEKVCESVTSTIIAVKINEKTQQLLESAQVAGEMMRAQEEEMRQNLEELQATQEEMARKERETSRMLDKAHEREEELRDRVTELERMQKVVELQNRELQKLRDEERHRLDTTIKSQKEIFERTVRKYQDKEAEMSERIRDLEARLERRG